MSQSPTSSAYLWHSSTVPANHLSKQRKLFFNKSNVLTNFRAIIWLMILHNNKYHRINMQFACFAFHFIIIFLPSTIIVFRALLINCSCHSSHLKCTLWIICDLSKKKWFFFPRPKNSERKKNRLRFVVCWRA